MFLKIELQFGLHGSLIPYFLGSKLSRKLAPCLKISLTFFKSKPHLESKPQLGCPDLESKPHPESNVANCDEKYLYFAIVNRLNFEDKFCAKMPPKS